MEEGVGRRRLACRFVGEPLSASHLAGQAEHPRRDHELVGGTAEAQRFVNLLPRLG
jgi:hypothetical protein